MKKTNLLVCPACEAKGLKQVLGEVDENGNLHIMRFHKGFTKVVSNDFSVMCGNCDEIVYRKLPVVMPIKTTVQYVGTHIFFKQGTTIV